MIERDRRSAGVRVWDLRINNCHWPLGELSETAEYFCGAPAKPGSPYCQEHRKRAFVRPYAVTRGKKPESGKASPRVTSG